MAWRGVLVRCLVSYPAGMLSRLRIVWYRLLGVKLSGRCWLRRVSIPRNFADIQLDSVALDDYVVLLPVDNPLDRPKIVIGQGTYINRFTMIDACNQVTIGANCMIGPYCYITDHDHRTDASSTISSQPLVSAPTILGNDVWIGAGAIILKGVTIGDGAVVGAGAVVTRPVAAGTVVAGVPAAVLRSRSGFVPDGAEPA